MAALRNDGPRPVPPVLYALNICRVGSDLGVILQVYTAITAATRAIGGEESESGRNQ